jgi:FkbM family methyltransferase
MSRILRNLASAVKRPELAFGYASWTLQNWLRSGGATRNICGVQLGNFNGFSEYHSVGGVSEREQLFLQRFQFGEGAILDVGANLGLFSLVLRATLPGRRIVAFEPAPSTYKSLASNVVLNAAANVECINAAVADRDGTASFAVREGARANSSLGASAEKGPVVVVDVPCVTLDRFTADAGIDRIALLKVDVEGFEAKVFEGAARILAEGRPQVVYFEVCPALARKEGFAPDAAAAKLEAHGYMLHRIGPEGRLEKASRSEIESVSLDNWVATR